MAVAAHKASEWLGELVDGPGEFRVRKIIHEIEGALGKAPNADFEALLHTSLGIAHCQLRHNDEALRQHRIACDLAKHRFINPNNYGVTLERLGRFAEALEWYFIAMEAEDGYNSCALGNCAVGLIRAGEADEGQRLLAEAIRIARPEDLFDLAKRSAEIGARPLAVKLLARLTARQFELPYDPENPVATVAAAPKEWQQAIVKSYELTTALLQTQVLSKRLRHLEPAAAPLQNIVVNEQIDALDAAVFEWTRRLRVAATREEFAGYAHG